MFERFTNQARRVVVLAQDESRELNHNYIGTEHLVLGLLREQEGAGARALKSADITLGDARREVETRLGRGQQQQAGHIPFTPRAKKSLELALRESLALGQDYIGTGHLLLGLIRKGDGVGVEVLVSLGADLNVVRERVIELLREDNEQAAAPARPERGAPPRAERSPRAERYPGQIHALLDAIDTRLSMIERHLEITRHVPAELRAFDKRIARVVGAKEEAIERQDFEEAAALREQEKQLRSERERLERELQKAGRGEGAEAAQGSRTEAADAGTAAGADLGAGPATGADLGAGPAAGADLGAGPATGEGTAAAEGPAGGRLTDEGTETAEGSAEGRLTDEGTETAEGSGGGPAAGEDLGVEPTAGEGTGAAGGPGAGAAAGQSGAGQVTGWSDEVAGLRAEVARLTALLREHGIDLGKPEDPPAVAG